MPVWVENFLPILILLAVVSFVIWRLPKIELGYSSSFRMRRVLNGRPMIGSTNSLEPPNKSWPMILTCLRSG